MAKIERRVTVGHNLVIDDERHTVTVSDPSGERVTFPQPRNSFVGTVVVVDESTLIVSLDGKPVQVMIPRAAIDEMAVSLGRSKRRSRGKTALLGVVLGGGGGILLGYMAGDDHCTPPHGADFFAALGSCLFTYTAREKATVFGTFFGVLGGLTGALTGGGTTERWEQEPSGSSRVKVSVRPQGRLGASISIGF